MANKRLKKELIEGMEALAEIGAISGATMKSFRRELLAKPPAYSPKKIRSIRESYGVSQAVFAALMNVSLSTIQKWEQGQKTPTAAALKLLEVVKKNGLNILLSE